MKSIDDFEGTYRVICANLWAPGDLQTTSRRRFHRRNLQIDDVCVCTEYIKSRPYTELIIRYKYTSKLLIRRIMRNKFIANALAWNLIQEENLQNCSQIVRNGTPYVVRWVVLIYILLKWIYCSYGWSIFTITLFTWVTYLSTWTTYLEQPLRVSCVNSPIFILLSFVS